MLVVGLAACWATFSAHCASPAWIPAAALLLLMGALAALDAERNATGSNIQTFGDALWWAASTITTVGYGDVTPISTTGRFIAVALMVGGIALLGTVTATIASWFVEQVNEKEEASQLATRQQVAELAARIDYLTELLGRDARPANFSPADPSDTAFKGLRP